LKTRWGLLIALLTLLVSGGAFATYGSGKVRSSLQIEVPCALLANAQKAGVLNAKQRIEIIEKVAAFAKLSMAAKQAAARLKSGCHMRLR
jgi:hypothetical protein